MKKLIITLIFTSLIFTQTDGEFVKNITGSQRTDGSKLVDIYYDLDENNLYPSYDITVTLIESGAAVDKMFLLDCAGDIYNNIFPGENKHIVCRLGTSLGEYGPATNTISSDNISFAINAKGYAISEIPFDMVTINSSSTPQHPNYEAPILDYDYEIMSKEVTAYDYVIFLNDLLSTATTIDVEDNGGTYKRRFHFDDGSYIYVWYSPNTGSGYLNGTFKLNMAIPTDNYATMYGVDYYYCASDVPYLCNQNEVKWINLEEVSDNDEYAKIEFSASSADNFSFYISPGNANYPVTDITYFGAIAFARHYGMRLPTFEEMIIPFYVEYVGLEVCGGIYMNAENIWDCSGLLEEFIMATNLSSLWNVDENINPHFLDPPNIYGLFNNGWEITFNTIMQSPYLDGEELIESLQGEHYPDYLNSWLYALAGNTIGLNYFYNAEFPQLSNTIVTPFPYIHNYDDNINYTSISRGFRCTRTLPINN